MAISDVAIIVLVVLCALFGLVFGTGKSFIGVIGWAGAFIIALFLTQIVAFKLIEIEFVKGFVFGQDGFSLLNFVIPFAPGISNDGIMASIFAPLLDPVIKIYGGTQVDAASAAVIAYAIYSAVVCLLLFIVARLLMMLVTWILKKIMLRKKKKPSPVSRLGGFVFGAVKGGVFSVIIFMIASFALVFPFIGTVVGADIGKSFIAKPVFNAVAPISSQMIAGNEDKMTARIKEIVQISGVIKKDTSEVYVIYFDTNGGPEIEQLETRAGQRIDEFETPVYEGYILSGWYYDAEFTQLVSLPFDMPEKDIVVYAKWTEESITVTPETYSITFETNGGGSIAAIEAAAGEAVTKPGNPTKGGYNFVGWYNDSGLTNPVEFPSVMPEGGLTLYAKWEEVVDLSPAKLEIIGKLAGENSILYTISGVPAAMFFETYSSAAIDAYYAGKGDTPAPAQTTYLLLFAIGLDVDGMDAAQLTIMQDELSDSGTFYLALSVLLTDIRGFVDCVETNGGDVDTAITEYGDPYGETGMLMTFMTDFMRLYDRLGLTLSAE